MYVLVYVIVWLAVVFGINSASNAGRKIVIVRGAVFGINSASNGGRKIVIVRGAAEHYYNFHTCIASTINYKYYSQPYRYRLIQHCCRR